MSISNKQMHNTLTPEIPFVFDCLENQLVGIIHQVINNEGTGVLIIVGGPQYRVGSHRQFVMLARHLALQQIPSMRFDVRGMGDSNGSSRNFAQIEDDIASAIDYFFSSCPNLKQLVLWGLCDAASAALFYAYQDNRVKGLVLLNPWVFTEQGAAKTLLKHYYLNRIMSKELWKKIFSLNFDYADSAKSLLAMTKQIFSSNKADNKIVAVSKIDENLALPIRMRECLKQFAYPILLILSGRDLTANEFKETVNSDPEWQALLNNARVTRLDFADADHTFSSLAWQDQVANWTSDWIINGLKKL